MLGGKRYQFYNHAGGVAEDGSEDGVEIEMAAPIRTELRMRSPLPPPLLQKAWLSSNGSC